MSIEEWKECKEEGRYIGVERPKCGTYFATFCSGSNHCRLGTFENLELAAFAYEEAKRKRDKHEEMKKKGKVLCGDSQDQL